MNYMRYLSHIFIFLFLAGIIAFSSCRDEATTVGEKLFESSFKNYQTDTCTVLLSTVLSDSLATSSDTLCQIGHYHDTTHGDITASFFTEYNVTSTSLYKNRGSNSSLFENRYRFDSITVRFYSDSCNYVGDSLSGPQQIAIHKLKKNIELDDNGYLYNKSEAVYDPTPLTTISYIPHPNQKKKEIETRLPDSFGEDFFNLMLQSDDRMEQQIYFRDYFKGLAFLPTNSDRMLNGFQVNDSSFVIALYYHDITNTPIAEKAVFTPNKTLSFGKVKYDRTGTPLAALKPGYFNALPSSKTNNAAYLQGLTGLYTMISFPFLNDINAEGEMVSIEKAYLQLYPVRFSYGANYPLPKTLSLYTTDVNGVTQDLIYNLGGTAVQTGNLVTDDATYTETYYTFDLTSFMQSLLGTSGSSMKKLKLVLPNKDFFSSCKGVMLGDMDHPTSNVKLTLVYKTYNEKK